MADFVAVLRKTIDGLRDNSPEMREKVYDKARATIEAKLAALDPAPPAAIVDRQRKALEDAIATVRADYEVATPENDLEDELAGFFGDDSNFADPPRPETSESSAGAAGYAAAEAGLAPAGGSWQDEAAPGNDWERDAPPQQDWDGIPARAQEDRDVSMDGPSDATDDAYDDAYGEHAGEWSAADEPRTAPLPPARDPRRGKGGLIAAVLILLVLAAGVYGIWLNRADLGGLFGAGGSQDVVSEPLVSQPADQSDEAEAPTAEDETDSAALDPEASETAEQEKFTQRLLPDGTEVDDGAAGDRPTIGEGTSVAASTPGEAAQGASPAQASDGEPQLAVGQRAIYYEERTSTAEGSAETGTILWSLVQESPGGDLPPEAAIRAEVTIPARDLQLRMTVRRNGDPSLPASHIIEMIFLTPDDFAGGTIDNVLRVAMKDTEQDTGTPLIGIPAKIADGFFLVALSDASVEVQANTNLMRQESWLDIPIVYGSGRRALMTIEKGVPGNRVFQEALRAWSAAEEPPADESDQNG